MTDEYEEEHFEEKPFLEHLEDLRMTLFKIIVATLIGAMICLLLSQKIFAVFRAPLERHARIVSIEEALQKAEKLQPPPKPTPVSEEKAPPSEPPPGNHVVVTGPLGQLVMLTRDLFQYSKEAVSYLRTRAERPPGPLASDRKKPGAVSARKSEKSKAKSSKEEKTLPVVRLMETGPTRGFMVVIKTAFLCGIAITLPFNLFFLGQFVFPALTRKEKKYVTPSFVIGGVLFAIGLLFGYFLIVPLALQVFLKFNLRYGLDNIWRMSEYLGNVTKLLIASGIMFEMPLLLTILVRIGVLSVTTLRKKRRHALVIILFASALLTPPDAATMFMLAMPMALLYEACIWGSWFLMRKKRLQEQQEEEHESYWKERKRVKEAEHVKPEEPHQEPPSPEPRKEQDSGSPDDSYSEDSWREDQSGGGQPPSDGDFGAGDMHDNFPEPGQEPPDEDEEKPESRGD